MYLYIYNLKNFEKMLLRKPNHGLPLPPYAVSYFPLSTLLCSEVFCMFTIIKQSVLHGHRFLWELNADSGK
jgi:hypothetical protein